MDDILRIVNRHISISRSSFYYNLKLVIEGRSDRWKAVKARICVIFAHHNGRYGYRRITLQLRKEGIIINHKTVQKLMTELGLKSIRKKAARYKSYKGTVGKIAPNVVARYFGSSMPNRKWTTDITEVKIKGKKLYLSPILDMFNGEIVTYTISCHPDLNMVSNMLKQAFKKVTNIDGRYFIQTRDGNINTLHIKGC